MKIVDGEAPSAVSGQFAYDGLGRVTARIIGESWTHRFYDSSWRLLEESWPDDEEWSDRAARRQYVWDLRYIDAPVCMDVDWNGGTGDGDCTDAATGRAGTGGSNTGDEHLYYTQDGNWNVTGLVDGWDGKVVQRYHYDPYGAVQVLNGERDSAGNTTTQWTSRSTGIFANSILFAGYYRDDSGLDFVRNRVYSSRLGTWLQRDPGPTDAGPYADGMNLYQYVGGKPVSYVDPSGLWWPAEHTDLLNTSWNQFWTWRSAQPHAGGNPGNDVGKWMLGILDHAAKSQDDDKDKKDDNPRHYNRDVPQAVDVAKAKYHEYIATELQWFEYELNRGMNSADPRVKRDAAERSLWCLGRVTHSWQDYYAHAVLASTGKPGPAWSAGITGSPDNDIRELKPSSWDGARTRTEHGGGEPGWDDAPVLRKADAASFVAGRYKDYLNRWYNVFWCVAGPKA